MERGPLMLLLKNLLFTFLVPGSVAVYVPFSLVRDQSVGPAPWILFGSLLLACGGAIYAWCVWDFATFGGGTPAPIDAPKKLVVRGLYGYSRNPMYVGVLATILAWSVLYVNAGVLLYAAIVWLCFEAFVLFYEEPHLQSEFGEEYERYVSRVPRWLPIPGRAIRE